MNRVRENYVDNIVRRAQIQIDAGNFTLAWKLLEDVHIFSQALPAQHLYVHCKMLRLALRLRDFREVFGQVVRAMLAIPASVLRLYPEGNTGGSDVGIFEIMPISKKHLSKMKELDKREQERRENGGRIEPHQRQHPLTRR